MINLVSSLLLFIASRVADLLIDAAEIMVEMSKVGFE